MIPPRSPYCLIQEDLWPDKWKMLVSCVLLNRTARKQVEKILPQLFALCPTAKDMAECNMSSLTSIIAPLGFKNRRAITLIKLSKSFLEPNWKHASELPGVGEYAAAVWDIFVLNKMPSSAPNDHALTWYWHWRQQNDN